MEINLNYTHKTTLSLSVSCVHSVSLSDCPIEGSSGEGLFFNKLWKGDNYSQLPNSLSLMAPNRDKEKLITILTRALEVVTTLVSNEVYTCSECRWGLSKTSMARLDFVRGLKYLLKSISKKLFYDSVYLKNWTHWNNWCRSFHQNNLPWERHTDVLFLSLFMMEGTVA